jgi:hypothetical protein
MDREQLKAMLHDLVETIARATLDEMDATVTEVARRDGMSDEQRDGFREACMAQVALFALERCPTAIASFND